MDWKIIVAFLLGTVLWPLLLSIFANLVTEPLKSSINKIIFANRTKNIKKIEKELQLIIELQNEQKNCISIYLTGYSK